MKKEFIKAIIKKPGENATIRNIKNDLDTFQKIVCGDIEVINFIEETILFCNEEGKIHNLKPNIEMPYDVIVGNLIVVGCDNAGNELVFSDLTKDQIEQALKYLADNAM